MQKSRLPSGSEHVGHFVHLSAPLFTAGRLKSGSLSWGNWSVTSVTHFDSRLSIETCCIYRGQLFPVSLRFQQPTPRHIWCLEPEGRCFPPKMVYSYLESQLLEIGPLCERQIALQVAVLVNGEYSRCLVSLLIPQPLDPLQMLQPISPRPTPRWIGCPNCYIEGTIICSRHVSMAIAENVLCLFCAQLIFLHGTLHECLDGSPANSSCHGYEQTTTGNRGFGIMQTSMLRSVPGIANTSHSCLPEVI